MVWRGRKCKGGTGEEVEEGIWVTQNFGVAPLWPGTVGQLVVDTPSTKKQRIRALRVTVCQLNWPISSQVKRQEPCCRWETARSRVNFLELHVKAVLSQRWPRNVPYTWVPWKFLGLPDYAHGYYSQNYSWAFVPIDPMDVPTKFEVRSFTRSWDNRGYPKNLRSPWKRPRSLFSNFYRLLFGLAL